MSKSRRKSYISANKPSKRYTKCFDRLEFKIHLYEAGYCGARGHKTRSADNQTLSQLARSKEKRIWKAEIKNELFN